MADIEQMINEFKNSMTQKYCPECDTNCCRLTIPINKSEYEKLFKKVPLILNEAIEFQLQSGPYVSLIGNNENGKYFLAGGCRYLVKGKCQIHEDENRPETCKEYPVYLNEGKINASITCPIIRKEQKTIEQMAKENNIELLLIDQTYIAVTKKTISFLSGERKEEVEKNFIHKPSKIL